MTRQIRVYEPTARLIEEIVRRDKRYRSFADVVEAWAKELYDDVYDAVITADDRLSAMLPVEDEEADE